MSNSNRINEWLEEKQTERGSAFLKDFRIRLFLAVFALFFAFLILYFANYNIGLIFNGNRYEAQVTSLVSVAKGSKGIENRTITLTYQDKQGVENSVTAFKNDYDFFFRLRQGDKTTIYVSQSDPEVFYVPILYKGISIFVALFFVFIPLIFAVFGERK